MKYKEIIIDTHFHIWDATILTIPTLEMFEKQLKKKYTIKDYQEATSQFNIKKSIYTEVDAIKNQHKKETEIAIKLCKENPNHIAGATIAGDMSSGDFPKYIRSYAKQHAVKAVRHNLFAADVNVTKTTIFRDNVHLLADLDLMCDLVMPVEKIMFGVELVKSCPNTRFVIDHCGVCPILSDFDTREQWHQGINEYAQQLNTICKISECGFTNPDYSWKVDDVADIIHHCIDNFGEERIVYGTNWPICEITGSIARWLEAIHKTLHNLPTHYSENLFSKNATRYYKCE